MPTVSEIWLRRRKDMILLVEGSLGEGWFLSIAAAVGKPECLLSTHIHFLVHLLIQCLLHVLLYTGHCARWASREEFLSDIQCCCWWGDGQARAPLWVWWKDGQVWVAGTLTGREEEECEYAALRACCPLQLKCTPWTLTLFIFNSLHFFWGNRSNIYNSLKREKV